MGRDGPPVAAGHGTTAVAAHVPAAPAQVASTRVAHAPVVPVLAAAHVRVDPVPVDRGSHATRIRVIPVKVAAAAGVAAMAVEGAMTADVATMAAGGATMAGAVAMACVNRAETNCAVTVTGHAIWDSTARCRRVAGRARGAGAAVEGRSRSSWNSCANCSS